MTIAAPLSASALRLDVVDNDDALAALADEWDALAGNVPFRAWQWAECWWRHYGNARRRLLVLVVRDVEHNVLGIAPWYVERSAIAGRVIRFLGSGEICSDYLSILSLPENTDAVTACVANWLTGTAADRWDLIDLEGAAADDQALAVLAQQVRGLAHQLEATSDKSCWPVSLGDDWDSYIARLSRSRRERTRGMFRKLLETGRAKAHRANTPESLARGFDILVDLHQRRRHSLGDAGCFASVPFANFHREMTRRLMAAGQLRLCWLELDGHPVAAEYSIRGGDTIYYYQGGFDPDFAEIRPGWLCMAMALKRSIDEGCATFDFLRGDESYKSSWGAESKPLVRLRIVGRKPAARFRNASRRGATLLRDCGRRLLGRKGESA